MGCEGPRICGTEPACGGRQVRLHFRNAAGMYAHSENKGMEIKDFEIMDGEGRLFPVKAVIAENDVILTWKEKKTAIWKEENLFTGKEATARIQEIRYCYRNTNQGALLYNKDGFPMSPFRLKRQEILALAGMEDLDERKI